MPVQRFRTKVVEIEAVQFTGDNAIELSDWTGERFRQGTTVTDKIVFQVYDILHTTWINVTPGQWIVRGAKGEFYPCDDETFHWKYEEIKDPDFTMSGTLEYRDGEVTAEGFEFRAGTHNVDDEPVRYEPEDNTPVVRSFP